MRAKEVDGLTALQRRRELRATLDKLDAASLLLTGHRYGNGAKPAPPTNRAERRASERAQRRKGRARKKG